MILYLAGGFHFSNKVETEKELGTHLLNKYGRYNRLATFFYGKDAMNIQQAIGELDGKVAQLEQQLADGASPDQLQTAIDEVKAAKEEIVGIYNKPSVPPTEPEVPTEPVPTEPTPEV